MFNIQIASDLHIEFISPKSCDWDELNLITPTAPVLALIGDIGVVAVVSAQTQYESFIEWCCSKFEKVLLVPGNHEYYSNQNNKIPVSTVDAFFGDLQEKYENFIFLQKTSIKLNGINILGTTLWSDLIDRKTMKIVGNGLNDYRTIYKQTKNGQLININATDTQNWYCDQLQWLHDQLKYCEVNDPTSPVLVLTHHTPSMRGTSSPEFDYPISHPNYLMKHAFSSDLEYLIEEFPNLRCWCYGHTHYNNIQIRDKGKVLTCNQKGYIFDKEHDDLSHKYRKDFVISFYENIIEVNGEKIEGNIYINNNNNSNNNNNNNNKAQIDDTIFIKSNTINNNNMIHENQNKLNNSEIINEQKDDTSYKPPTTNEDLLQAAKEEARLLIEQRLTELESKNKTNKSNKNDSKSREEQWVHEKNSKVGPSILCLARKHINAQPYSLFSEYNDEIISNSIQAPEYLTQITKKYPCFLLKNILSIEECNTIISIIPTEGPGYMSLQEVQKRYRGRISDRFLSLDYEMSKLIGQRINRFIPQHLTGGKYIGLSPEWRYLHYMDGGHFDAHIDGREFRSLSDNINDDNAVIQSRLTVQIYLNTHNIDFTGGELSFLNYGSKEVKYMLKPEAGDCVIFFQELDTCDNYHEGNNVINGHKYAARTMAEYVWPSKEAMYMGEMEIRNYSNEEV
eukprot:gene12316-16519_t